MPQAKGIREVGWVDCAGGGQITVEKGIAYVGHMSAPHGTTHLRRARSEERQAASPTIEMPKGTHSHKVHVRGRHHGREP